MQDTTCVTVPVKGPVDLDPDVPVHPPGATAQAMAFTEVQLMVTESPELTEIGPFEPFALKSTPGANGTTPFTFITMESDAEPVSLRQVYGP